MKIQINRQFRANVGGEIMEAVMARMNLYGCMPLCGMISGYNAAEPAKADFTPILMRRIGIHDFIVMDFAAKYAEGATSLRAGSSKES
jgi:NADPH-dependent curcumin reductase CurA